MGPEFSELVQQAWRVLLLVSVPALAIPVAGAAFSLLMGLLGIKDEGLAYAARVLVMVGVGALCLPVCSRDVVALMTMALK
jgi:flagellar biosynthesis protein FliQ